MTFKSVRAGVVAFWALTAFGTAVLALDLLQQWSGRVVEERTMRAFQAKALSARLLGAYRFEQAGWIYVHLEGSPRAVGFQHGYLLAPEIHDAFDTV